MKKELIVTGETVEAAIESGCAQLGLDKSDVETEIIEKEQKGLFGKLKAPASVRILYTESIGGKSEKAKGYLEDILKAIGANEINISMEETEIGVNINLDGKDISMIIGHHGETLDAIQYLVSLVANAGGGDYFKVTIDCGNFREKREQTLVQLAKSVASTVMRTGNSSTLEPMNPYERRIIHSTISEIEGVSSKSIGEDPNRKIVVVSERRGQSNYSGRPARRDGGFHDRPRREKRPFTPRESGDIYSFEKGFKKSESKEEKLAKLYSKIETDE